jgi:cytochrome c biogenesis protein CcdA
MKNREHATIALIVFTAIVVSLTAFARTTNAQQEGTSGRQELVFFFSPTCHDCQKIKAELLPRLLAAYGNSFSVDYRDIGVMDNFKRLFELSARQMQAKREVKVPSIYFAGQLLVGPQEIQDKLEGLVAAGRARALSPNQSDGSGRASVQYNPLSHFKSFTPLAVIAAGSIDGINPCAFTVIVFFVSFLALQGFRRLHLAVVGSFFIAGVFITYLLIGLGLLGFFYKLSAFWQVRMAVNLIIGAVSIAFGIAALIDAAKYRKSGKTDGMLLSLPQAVKERIHAVIGMRYRGAGGREQSRTMMRLIITAFVTGFLVSLLEAVCTGQMYLPTIIFVLKSTTLKLVAFAYLVLYNIMFIVPLAIILVFSVLGTSSGQFSRFMARHFLAVKVMMAALFFILGIYLVWRG